MYTFALYRQGKGPLSDKNLLLKGDTDNISTAESMCSVLPYYSILLVSRLTQLPKTTALE